MIFITKNHWSVVEVILSTFARWQHNMRLYPVEQAFS